MKLSEQITEGTVIFSGGFAATESVNYTILGLQRYVEKTKRPMIPFFFKYSRELEYSMPEEDRIPTEFGSYDMKVERYKYCGFPVIPQKTKYSGFEKIKDYYDTTTNLVTFRDRLKYANKPSTRIFDIAFRYKLADKIGFHRKEPTQLQYYE